MTIVETKYGRLRGEQREAHLAFRGIRFAGPAGGGGRFRAPTAPEHFDGVRDVTAWGTAARQTSHPIPGFAASGPQDEDCLFLNAFTPGADGARRPVLFWIHGGGFTHGTAAEPLYDGGPLAVRGDVVVVSINYRLGAFGYLYLGEHLPGAGLAANPGQLDQVAALEWVRDNIAAFGGDPGNVTIFGESAGAAAVGTLLAMPAAKGLFRRAILQSGSGRASEPEQAARVTSMLLQELGLEKADAAELLQLPADAILGAQTAVVGRAREFGLPFGPVRDAASLPQSPIDAIKAGEAADIPVLIGTNRDEVKLFAASMRREPLDDAALVKAVAATLPGSTSDDARRVVEVFRASRTSKGLPGSNLDILDAVGSEARFRASSMRLAAAQREHQPDTYAYLFTYASPARHGALGSCHALEMPFVFGTLNAPTQDKFAGSGPDVEQLSANMMDAWLAFAKTGNPSHPGIGAWPAFDAQTRATMIFDRQCRPENDPFAEERRALEAFV